MPGSSRVSDSDFGDEVTNNDYYLCAYSLLVDNSALLGSVGGVFWRAFAMRFLLV